MKLINIKYLAISSILGFLFTVATYNLDVILFYLQTLYEKHILIYICAVIFHFFLFLFISKRINSRLTTTFIITIITPLLIDASVLVTNIDYVPARFPFATIFPIIGAGLAVLKIKRSKYIFRISILVVLAFFYITYQFIIPKLFFYTLTKNTKDIPNNFFNKTFYSIDNNPIILKDTISSKCVIIECFFKGCKPCETKKNTLEKLRKKYHKNNLSILFICDGSITNYKEFLSYSNANKDMGFIFLYDRYNVLKNEFKISSYPFEIFSKDLVIIKTLTGFDAQIENEYYNEKIIDINKTINETNNN